MPSSVGRSDRAPSAATTPISAAGDQFDIIGDVHGCIDELHELLRRLGYANRSHPAGRKLVFVGDLVNRGPDPVAVLSEVMAWWAAGQAESVLGNHDDQLRWALSGRRVAVSPELARTLDALRDQPASLSEAVRDFLHQRPTQLWLDDQRVIVAHAGLPERLQGHSTVEASEWAVYGPSTGRRDNYGFPERVKPTPTEWAEHYTGRALVVHGHKAIPTPRWLGRTLNIDSNCSRGGFLSAFRYPEQQLVSVAARAVYWSAEGG